LFLPLAKCMTNFTNEIIIPFIGRACIKALCVIVKKVCWVTRLTLIIIPGGALIAFGVTLITGICGSISVKVNRTS
jgi:hypothetical protein